MGDIMDCPGSRKVSMEKCGDPLCKNHIMRTDGFYCKDCVPKHRCPKCNHLIMPDDFSYPKCCECEKNKDFFDF